MEKAYKCTKKDEKDLEYLQWFIFKTSQFTIWHRPKPTHIILLKEKFNLTALVTLQSEKENLGDLQAICEKLNIKWFHIPLEGANLPLLQKKSTKSNVKKGLKEILCLINESKNETFLIHCAAGIHRTGIFTYSIFRLLGFVCFCEFK